MEPPNDRIVNSIPRAPNTCPIILITSSDVSRVPAFGGNVPNGIEGIVPPSSACRTRVMKMEASATTTIMQPIAAFLRSGANGPFPTDHPPDAFRFVCGRVSVGSAPGSRGGKLGRSSSRCGSNSEGGGDSGLRTGSTFTALGGDFSPIVLSLPAGEPSPDGDGIVND